MIRLNRWTLLSLTVLVVATYGLTRRVGQDDTKMDESAMTSHAAIVPEEMEGTYQSLIEQAKIDAQNGHLKEAVLKLEGVPKNSQHSSVAEQLTEETAHALMQRAGNKYQQADLRTALLMLNAVPVSSQNSTQAKALQTEWTAQAKQLSLAQGAAEKHDWNSTIKAIEELKGTPLFQNEHVQALLQMADSKVSTPNVGKRVAVAMLPAQMMVDTSEIATAAMNSVKPENTANDALTVAEQTSATTVAEAPSSDRPNPVALMPAMASSTQANRVKALQAKSPAKVSQAGGGKAAATPETQPTAILTAMATEGQPNGSGEVAPVGEPNRLALLLNPVSESESQNQKNVTFVQLEANGLAALEQVPLEGIDLTTAFVPTGLDTLTGYGDSAPKAVSFISVFSDALLREKRLGNSPESTTRAMLPVPTGTVRVARQDLIGGVIH